MGSRGPGAFSQAKFFIQSAFVFPGMALKQIENPDRHPESPNYKGVPHGSLATKVKRKGIYFNQKIFNTSPSNPGYFWHLNST
jgi:hypothetical protein